MARNLPDDPDFPGSTVQHIANIRTNSAMTTSTFGDSRLFFKHARTSLDLEHEPTWRRYFDRLSRDDAWADTPVLPWPETRAEATGWVRGSMSEYNCPFAWLLNNEITPIGL